MDNQGDFFKDSSIVHVYRCKDCTHLSVKKQAKPLDLMIKEEEQVWELEIPDHSPKTLLII